MAKLCSNCGRELGAEDKFCTECGTRVIQVNLSLEKDSSSPNEGTLSKRQSGTKKWVPLIITFSVIGLVIAGIAAYFIIVFLKDSRQDAASAVSIPGKTVENISLKMEEDSRQPEAGREESIIERYTKKLNALKIHTSGIDISIGGWKIISENGRVSLDASQIPAKDLARIFDLYDTGNVKALKNWAKDVYYIAEDLSQELNDKWSIEAGNTCVSEYPATLSNADLSAYSGSCGYSIPVLTGTEKDDLSLVIHTSVFGKANDTSPPPAPSPVPLSGEFIFPYSDVLRLTESEIAPLSLSQLRLARNEIYARHGYIFKSADLREYFSNKLWYYQDPSFDETSLNNVEKYNVELIKNRESFLK
ncbi:YARHG domain-containing protein [Neobacillus mesonae]|uniref:YARHG domain-containing protein n=1 Tax=Neobacillus mesonae TaxID=1193713 RepID=UPI00204157B7|nr:YARHG domain-containing protein [Neobacillus mesonae]MCM3568527.1 YARHG domain-containing protein [Neobacillus mesonae]